MVNHGDILEDAWLVLDGIINFQWLVLDVLLLMVREQYYPILLLLVGVVRAHYPGATITGDSNGAFLNYSSIADITNNQSIYNSSVDSKSYGSIKGFLRRPYVGAGYTSNTISGSRSIYGDDSTARRAAAARGCSDKK